MVYKRRQLYDFKRMKREVSDKIDLIREEVGKNLGDCKYEVGKVRMRF